MRSLKQSSPTQRVAILGMLLLNVVLVGGCGDKAQEIPGTVSIDHFKKQAHWIYVYPKQGVANDALYTTSLLSPFTPGHPLSVAIGLYGKPKTEVSEEHGARYLIYETKNGIIKLGSETDESGYTGFPMYFVPNDRRPAAFFCAEIVEQINTSASKQVVMLVEPGYTTPFLHAEIEYGQIQKVIVHDPAAVAK
jgi:hypothetical protein